MPNLFYLDAQDYSCSFEVSLSTRNMFEALGMISHFRDIYDLRDWLTSYGTTLEVVNAMDLCSQSENITINNEGNNKMSINKQEAAILNVLNYFGELTEDELIKKLTQLKAYNTYSEFSQSKDSLRNRWGYVSRHNKNNKIYYKAAISYGSY